MIAGLLALVLAASDTTTRFAPEGLDSLAAVEVVVAAPSIAAPAAPAAVPLDALVPTVTAPVSAAMVRFEPRLVPWTASDDTVPRKKRKLVEYSEWYGRRLMIHKTLSWAMLPLFAVSYYTGDQLAEKGKRGVSGTVRSLHPLAAGGAAAVFGVNTVTGLWNLWDARHDPEGRTRRIIHSVLFLAADAGFAYAGSLGEDAGENGETRSRHRNIALGSMGVSTLGWLIMLIGK